MKYLFLSALSLVLLSMGQHASAYSYLRGDCGRIIYNGGHVTFNFGDNLSSDDKQIIDLAFDRLTAFSDTSITTNDNGDSSYSVGNGQNEIYFDSSVPTAVCNTRYNTESCRMSEVDIRFGAPTWTTDRDSNHLPYDNSARSLLGTAIHEGGHCIGMGHVNTVYNIMGEEWDHVTRNTTSTYYGPGEDISDGLIDRYGKKSADDSHRDVGVTDFRYSGVDGAYSEHRPGVLRRPGGAPWPVVGSFRGQDIFEVVAGDPVTMELTFENNGEKNVEQVKVGFYLSGNSRISRYDTLLKTKNSYRLHRGAPYQVDETVEIPANLTPGRYFIGAYVDYDNAVAEVTGRNNVAYYPIEVLPPRPDLTVPFAGVNNTAPRPLQEISLLAIVRNQGLGASAASNLRFYRSVDSVISRFDTFLSGVSVNSLQPGAQRSYNEPYTLPIGEGTFYIGACVDANPRETATNNQCSTGMEVKVEALPPEIAINQVEPLDGGKARISYTYNSNGNFSDLFFDWGSDPGKFENTVSQEGIPNGERTRSTEIDGLACGTTYYVRIRIVTASNFAISETVSFTTAPCPGCG